VKLYRTGNGNFVECEGRHYRVPEASWDALMVHHNLHGYLDSLTQASTHIVQPAGAAILAPIGSQEVWAAGVTYYRSRDARMTESRQAGGGDFYDRVYAAERPELFFKATAGRVVAPGAAVRIRRDSSWSVPEPELTVVVNPGGAVIGYTIGNDMSARDIEGENPLYLPQAKIYDRSCAIGPCVLVSPDPLATSTRIRIEIDREGRTEFSGATTLAQLSRKIEILVAYLFRDNVFPVGAYLMTGTGVVPPDSFTLAAGDRVRITIDAIGTLENTVVQGGL
jgi:2-dehydro-3-deoxy-D-arabinonate dehydratase